MSRRLVVIPQTVEPDGQSDRTPCAHRHSARNPRAPPAHPPGSPSGHRRADDRDGAYHLGVLLKLPIAEISTDSCAPATVNALPLYDATGEQARAVKARYRGYCRTCGARAVVV